MATRVRALPARRSLGLSVVSLADAAAFGVLVTAVIAVPLTFSIANRDVFSMPKAIVAVALAALLGLLLGTRWIASGRRLRDLRRNRMAWALAVFVALNLLAALFAIDHRRALIGERLQYQGLGLTLAYVVYLIAAHATVRTARRRMLLLAVVVAAASIVATYAVVQRLQLDPIWAGVEINRAFSTIGQSNALAAYLVMTIPLTLPLAFGRRLAVQLAVTGLVVLEVAALAFTLSRGGYLGAGVAAAVLLAVLLVRRGELMSRRGLAVAALALATVLVASATLPGPRAAAERTVTRAMMTIDFEDGSIEAHLDQWAVGAAIVADHPLLGTGQETYVLHFDGYLDEVVPPERHSIWEDLAPGSPHNHYLAIAVGAGVPALLAYLAIFGIAGRRTLGGVRASRDPRTAFVGAALLAAVAGHLVTDSFMTAETSGTVLAWTVVGVGSALGDDG